MAITSFPRALANLIPMVPSPPEIQNKIDIEANFFIANKLLMMDPSQKDFFLIFLFCSKYFKTLSFSEDTLSI